MKCQAIERLLVNIRCGILDIIVSISCFVSYYFKYTCFNYNYLILMCMNHMLVS